MSSQIADQELQARGIAVLESNLGPVQTLRFLSLLSRQPFDYEQWREEEFGKLTPTELLALATAQANPRP